MCLCGVCRHKGPERSVHGKSALQLRKQKGKRCVPGATLCSRHTIGKCLECEVLQQGCVLKPAEAPCSSTMAPVQQQWCWRIAGLKSSVSRNMYVRQLHEYILQTTCEQRTSAGGTPREAVDRRCTSQQCRGKPAVCCPTRQHTGTGSWDSAQQLLQHKLQLCLQQQHGLTAAAAAARTMVGRQQQLHKASTPASSCPRTYRAHCSSHTCTPVASYSTA